MSKPENVFYSTCTFDPLENKQTIEYLLEQFPEFTICEMKEYEGFTKGKPEVTKDDIKDLEKTVRIFPRGMQEGEGHYLALLKKENAIERSEKSSK